MTRRNDSLRLEHLRYKPVKRRQTVLHCVLLDCSASMMSVGQLALAKGVLLDLGRQIYQQRESMAVFSFAGDGVQLLHGAHRPGVNAADWVKPIVGGGGSPVQLAVHSAEQMMLRHQRRWPDSHRVLWLFSDGRYEPLPALPCHVHECHVVDFESGYLRLGRVRKLAELWQAHYTPASHWVADSGEPRSDNHLSDMPGGVASRL